MVMWICSSESFFFEDQRRMRLRNGVRVGTVPTSLRPANLSVISWTSFVVIQIPGSSDQNVLRRIDPAVEIAQHLLAELLDGIVSSENRLA